MSCKLKLINTTAGGEASCLPRIPRNLEEVSVPGLSCRTNQMILQNPRTNVLECTVDL